MIAAGHGSARRDQASPGEGSRGSSSLVEAGEAQAVAALLETARAREQAGDWQAAADLYTEAFRRGVGAVTTDLLVDALRSHARVRRLQRRYEEAEELAGLSWEVACLHGMEGHAARALNMIAVLQHEQGNLLEARRLYEEALEQARDAGDDTLISFVCQNLGVIANIHGDLREARTLYLESIGASIRARDEASAITAYNNLGMVCTDLGEYMEAALYFDRGIESAERRGDAANTARLYVNQAETLIHLREFARAAESLDRAEEIATRIQSRATLADQLRFRGMIARLQGDLHAAERYLEQTLQAATVGKLELSRAEALEEMGRLRRVQGRAGEARQSLEAAREAFLALGAARDADRVARLLVQEQAVPQP